MITIYGSPKSSAGRCYWCLEELGIEYETKNVNFREKEHKSEAYLKLNPNGKVPVLTDGEFTIWESMGINLYLAQKYKPELLGNSFEEKGLVFQWTIFSICELQPPLIDIFIQKVFVPEERRDQKVIDKALEKLPNLLNVIDQGLNKFQFLAGNEFTLADLNTASVVSICRHIEYDISGYVGIQKWLGQLAKREAFQKYLELLKD